MNPEESKRMIMETFDAFGAGHWDDPATILKNLAEDGQWWVAGTTKLSGTMTKSQMMEMLRGVGNFAESGLKFTPSAWLVSGDRAAVETDSCMKLKDGREYKNSYHMVFEFRAGKIQRVKEYMDTAYVVEFFGA